MKQSIIGGFLFIGGIMLMTSFIDHRNFEGLGAVGFILGFVGLIVLLIQFFINDSNTTDKK